MERQPNFSIRRSPDVRYWIKRADKSCPKSFDPKLHHSPEDAGYKECPNGCGEYAMLDVSSEIAPDGRSYEFVQALLYNWSAHLDYCYAVTYYPGSP